LKILILLIINNFKLKRLS